MAALAVHSFLGQVARPHYEAVARLLATRTRRPLEPVRETPLAELPAVVAGPPALLFLCGLPYTRMRAAGSAIEPLAAPVPDGADAAVNRADPAVAADARHIAPEQLLGSRTA